MWAPGGRGASPVFPASPGGCFVGPEGRTSLCAHRDTQQGQRRRFSKHEPPHIEARLVCENSRFLGSGMTALMCYVMHTPAVSVCVLGILNITFYSSVKGMENLVPNIPPNVGEPSCVSAKHMGTEELLPFLMSLPLLPPLFLLIPPQLPLRLHPPPLSPKFLLP